ncbi:filamentous hemagglutinin N-terminal domain-containing protein, partial [Uruburuella suis]|uniref:two-partner secretion domain-containing protein n=1 Tax=Uruburuella suis TaxID=252130 RepID=UPI00248F7BC1
MNKHLHKIIFNKKRGCMMAVAEHAAREGKSTQDSSARAGFTLQAGMPMLAACGVLLGGIGFAQAQIIADKSAPANQQAAVLKHSSGAPLVNIQTPTAKGLSHNRYTQFDVDNKGAVLNNSRTANPNLAKGSAKVILNEIRSTSPSKLAGIISVEGSRADVIIANPAGIQVNGGGFKNANRAVLTTGAPVIKEGALHQLDIRQGTVAIGAGGLNDAGSTGAGYTEILSRAATVQGKIQANQLTIATGAQKIDYASGEISNGSAAGTKPALAIDTAALGSMYAGSITLIANEKGLGVKNAGTLQAERQLVLTSAGKIENSGQIRTTSAATEAAPTYLSLTTTDQAANSGNGDIDSTAGKIESKGLMVVDAGRDLVLSNTALNQSNVQTASAIILDAGRHIQINKKAALTNSGSGAISAAAGGNITINDAKFGSSGQIYTAAQGSNHLQNNSTLNAKQDISILANGNVQLNAGHLASSAGSIHLEAAKPASLAANPAPANANISGGSLSAAKNIVALADNDISATTTIKAAEAVYLHAGKNLNLTVGAELPAATQNVSLKAGEKALIGAASPKNLNAAKDLSIAAGSITVERLNLKAGSGNLSLSAQSGDLGLAPNTQLNAGQNIEAAALQGNIVSDGLNATAANGHLSIMAAGRVDLLSTGTAAAKLSGKTGVALGSVGKGRLKTDNTDITAAEGDIRLVSGADMIIGNGKQQNTLLAHHIQAQSSNGALSINHAKISATRGALQLEAKQDLTLSQVAATSSQNTTIAADAGKVHLNQVNAGAGRHMAISSRNNQILQNDKQSTANTLKANGVLSIHSGWWHNANNSQMQGGAVHLKSNGSAITLGGNSSVKALSNPVLKNDAKLKSLDGSINIEAKSDVHIQPGYTVAADGNFHLKAGNKLTLAGKSGNKGNPSATTSTLSAKGEIKLIAGEADIQAAKIAAGKDLTVGTTKGKLNIDAVSSKFSDYTPEQKVAELRRDIRALEQQIEAAKKANAKDKRLAAWDNEKGRLEFYIQAINKTVKGHKPKGYEYKQATLSGQNINLISAQGIEVSGSDVLAEKKLNIQAAGILPKVGDQTQSAIFIDGVADSYEIGLQRFKSHYDKAVINKPSRLQGKQGITIQAPAANDNARIIIGASQLNAPNGRIDIKAYGDILLESGENNAYTFLKTKSRSGSVLRKTKFTHNTNHLIMPAPVELNSGVGIGLQAGGNIDAYSTRFNAPKGKIALVAGEELNLLAVEGQHSHRFETNKSTRFVGLKIKNKDYKREELTETKLPVKMIARGVNTRSGWDTVLEGTEFETGLAGADIQAGVGEKAKADAKIILQGIKTTVQKEESSKSNAVVWQSMAGSGSVVETLALPKFEGPTPPKLSAPGGYIVDIPKGQLKTEIEKLARQPEYAYLKQLQLSKDVDWNQVQLEYQKWDYKQEGLTGAGAAIIALALAAVTGGAGAGIATALSGTVVTGTSAAMANAAFLSLATQASISLVNNKGNL